LDCPLDGTSARTWWRSEARFLFWASTANRVSSAWSGCGTATSIHTGMVHGYTIQSFLDKIGSGKMDAAALISHPFSLGDVEEAYTFFRGAAKTGSLKVLLSNDVTVDPADDDVAQSDEE